MPISGADPQKATSRAGSRNGRGRSRTAFTTLKMAALAPMPRDRVRSATAVRPGFRRRERKPYRTSPRSPLSQPPATGLPSTGADGSTGRSSRRSSSRRASPVASSSRTTRRASASGAPSPTSSRKRSSRCWASSSMISSTLTASRSRSARRRLTSGLQSRILGSHDAAHRFHELRPASAPGPEDVLPLRGQAVIASASLPGLLHPAAQDPPSLLEAVEEGVEGRHVEAKRPPGAGLDQAAEVVAVAGLALDQGKDEQLGAALLEVRARHGVPLYIVRRHMATKRRPGPRGYRSRLALARLQQGLQPARHPLGLL